MRVLKLFLLCLFLVGCGSGSGTRVSTPAPQPTPTDPTPSDVAMVPGQWEFVSTPNGGGTATYFDVNVAVSGTTVTVSSTQSVIASPQAPADNYGVPFFGFCVGSAVAATISGDTLSGTYGPSGNFSGTLSANGSSFTGTFTGVAESPDCGNIVGTGTVSGYTVPQFQTTYSGTLENGSTMSLLVVQGNGSFNAEVSGSTNLPGYAANIAAGTLAPGGAGNSWGNNISTNVVGASIAAAGDVNDPSGAQQEFQFSGHVDPTGKTLTVLTICCDSNNNRTAGVLTAN